MKYEDIQIKEVQIPAKEGGGIRLVATLKLECEIQITEEVLNGYRDEVKGIAKERLRHQIANELFGDMREKAMEAQDKIMREISPWSNFGIRGICDLFSPFTNAGQELTKKPLTPSP